MKSQMRELFTKQLKWRVRGAMENIKKRIWYQCNKTTIKKLIEEHRNHLTQFAVSCKGSAPEHFFALHVGEIGLEKTPLFYQKGNFYRSVEKSRAIRDESPLAPLVELCSFEEVWVSSIIEFLEDKVFFQNDSPDKIVVSKEFFVS